jgi:hypothetical protein
MQVDESFNDGGKLLLFFAEQAGDRGQLSFELRMRGPRLF